MFGNNFLLTVYLKLLTLYLLDQTVKRVGTMNNKFLFEIQEIIGEGLHSLPTHFDASKHLEIYQIMILKIQQACVKEYERSGVHIEK